MIDSRCLPVLVILSRSVMVIPVREGKVEIQEAIPNLQNKRQAL